MLGSSDILCQSVFCHTRLATTESIQLLGSPTSQTFQLKATTKVDFCPNSISALTAFSDSQHINKTYYVNSFGRRRNCFSYPHTCEEGNDERRKIFPKNRILWGVKSHSDFYMFFFFGALASLDFKLSVSESVIINDNQW